MTKYAKIGPRGKKLYPVIEIERGIPIPAARENKVKRAYYPWAEMSVGDSIVILTPNASNVSAMIRQAGYKHGVKFVMRRINADDGNFRVWRIE